MGFDAFKNLLAGEGKRIANTDIIQPVQGIVDQNLQDVVTTIGAFIIRSVRGKFQRSISFTIGVDYSDQWMEEALYGILYKYNNIRAMGRLELKNQRGVNDGSAMYYRLDDGTHNLKYRGWDILLAIQTSTPAANQSSRMRPIRIYTIITYYLGQDFVINFERDMLANRNAILKIKKDSPTINIYQDYHEGDGYTYWQKIHTINKRRIGTVYLPREQKMRIVQAINNFFGNKKMYVQNGIAHNLKILLYGPPGPQPVSIRIPTPDGMKRFGDLTVGDIVFDHNGNPTKVTEIYPKGLRDVYEVRFLNGRKTKCTADHLWKVLYRSHGEWNEDVVPLQYILDSSHLMDATDGSQVIISEKRWSVQTNGAARFKERPLHIDPYVMGILITNGCLTDEYLRISQPTSEVPNALASITGMHVTPRSDSEDDYSYIFYDDSCNRVKTSEFLKEYPMLINVKSPNRAIPQDFLFNSIENRLALLNGLMDGDGSIIERSDRDWTSPMVRFTTTSKALSEQFVWLCRSLGFDCVTYIDGRNRYTSGYCANIAVQVEPRDLIKLFRVSYKMETAIRSIEGFYHLRSEDQLKWNKYHDKSKIISVKKLPDQEEVMCITVSSPDHLYLTEDFVVTHNSGKDSIVKMIASEWNRNLYYVTGGKDNKFIPNALTDDSDEEFSSPLLLISDIDKYPYLISEPDINIDDPSAKEERIKQKQMFGSMINALDGILSGEDRIVVMTTNHIEKFSDVFLRDGRVDIKEEIGYITPEVFRQYVHDMYNYDVPEDVELTDDELTVAKMQTDVIFKKLSIDEFLDKYVKKPNGKK